MKHKPRQIDLPDEVRAQFPESLGTLKHIKVLTNDEFAELNGYIPKKYEDEGKKEPKNNMWRCGYFEYDHPDDCILPVFLCHKFECQLLKEYTHCSQCPNHIPKSQIKLKRAHCSYRIWNFIGDKPDKSYKHGVHRIYRSHCIMKGIEDPDYSNCIDCNEWLERSKWSITFHIIPIDTKDIELPTIHYKKESKQKTPNVDDSKFT